MHDIRLLLRYNVKSPFTKLHRSRPITQINSKVSSDYKSNDPENKRSGIEEVYYVAIRLH
jgi:hypothetical protein